MKEKLRNASIKNRLVFGYGIAIALMVLVALVGMSGLKFLNDRLNAYTEGAQAADTAVKNCRIYSNIAARNIREMILNKDESANAAYKTSITSSIETLESNLIKLKDSGMLEAELYNQYEAAINNWISIGNKIIKETEAGNDENAAQMVFEQCVPALDNLIAISKEIDIITDKEKASAINLSHSTMLFDVILIAVILIIASALAFVIGKQIIDSITIPLGEIETVAKELSEGNLHSNIEYHSEDEIGKLAHSLRKSIRILGSYVDDIDNAMKEFSTGNFDVHPEVDWKGDFISILESFMNFEKNMAGTIKNIQAVANQVTNGAEQVSASSMDLARGATEQAGITEELSSTIENVLGRVRQNSENAKSISVEVEQVGSSIVNSNGKMQEMVESMNEINASSKEISKIISAINDIASQTNLLALNASIEAARAGEAGKGFAVVADQVSVLASQSAQAVNESKALIDNSVLAVDRGVVIANETAKQLEKVAEDSKVITEKVTMIAVASADQTEAISQITAGVEHINDVVQTNSANSEECAAASQEMSGQAETLREHIRKFKVGKFD